MKKIILIICSIFSLVSCNNEETNNFEEPFIDDSFLNGTRNILASDFYQYEGNYYIYYYSLMCEPCKDLKEYISPFIGDNENVYTLCVQSISNDLFYTFKQKEGNKEYEVYVNEMLGKSSIEDTYLIGTPTLYEINEHKLINVYLGYQNIYKFLGE